MERAAWTDERLDDLATAVVAIESRLRDQHADLAVSHWVPLVTGSRKVTAGA
jgi:hypothetical protein